MIFRLVRVGICLAVGATLLTALFWLFLNTPESNLLTLGISATLVVIMAIAVAVVVNTALLLTRGLAWLTTLRGALRGVHWPIVAAVPAAVIWWSVAKGDAWINAHAGEINAWFIATLGWADIAWLFQAEQWISGWIRWVVIPLGALSLIASLLERGASGLTRRWIRRAWNWRSIVLSTLVFIVLLALPWRLTTWRPALPPTWVQPAVAALRLAAVAVLATIGGALFFSIAAWIPEKEPR